MNTYELKREIKLAQRALDRKLSEVRGIRDDLREMVIELDNRRRGKKNLG